jgi:hypothetical protein
MSDSDDDDSDDEEEDRKKTWKQNMKPRKRRYGKNSFSKQLNT